MDKLCGNCKYYNPAEDIVLMNGDEVHLTSHCRAINDGTQWRPRGIEPHWKCSNNRFEEKPKKKK